MEGLDSGVVLSGVNGVHRVRYGKGKRCPARVEERDIVNVKTGIVESQYSLVITVDFANENVIPLGNLSPLQRQIYADVIKAFEDGGVDAVAGTPLHFLPFLTKQRIVEYKSRGIRSAQDLIGLAEPQMAEMGMGTRDEMRKAEAWLKSAADAAIVSRQDEELEKLRAELAETRALLEARLEPSAEVKRGPGRPRKETNEEIN